MHFYRLGELNLVRLYRYFAFSVFVLTSRLHNTCILLGSRFVLFDNSQQIYVRDDTPVQQNEVGVNQLREMQLFETGADRVTVLGEYQLDAELRALLDEWEILNERI